jgi:hypothetical protein
MSLSMNSKAVAMLEKENGRQIGCMKVDFHGRPSNELRLQGSKSQSKDGLILDDVTYISGYLVPRISDIRFILISG